MFEGEPVSLTGSIVTSSHSSGHGRWGLDGEREENIQQAEECMYCASGKDVLMYIDWTGYRIVV